MLLVFFISMTSAMLLEGTEAAPSGCGHVQADVMFLIDTSRSVGAPNFQKMIAFAVNLTSSFNIGPSDVQVGVVLFSAFVLPQITLSKYNTTNEVVSAIAGIRYVTGSTATDKGLRYIREHSFTPSDGDRVGVTNILIMLTDGTSDDPAQTAVEARLLKDSGAEIYAVGIGSLVEKSEMEVVATDQSHVTMTSDFSQLQQIQDNIRTSLCNRLNPCLSAPCQHGGTCDNNAGTYSCQCTSGYTGKDCQDVLPVSGCRHVSADVVFLVDSSRSVGVDNFKMVLKFLADFCDVFDLGQDAMQIGVVTFSTVPTRQMDIAEYSDVSALKSAILNISYLSGGTNTAAGLDFVRSNSFTTAAGDRSNVPNIAIVLTDGKSNSQPATTVQARLLREAGVEIFALGIGLGIDMDELKRIASPGSEHVLNVSSFDRLGSIQDTIKYSLCQNINECASSPCQHGGQCQDGVGTYTCQCTSGFTGNNCQTEVRGCGSSPCQYGGTCTDLPNGQFSCICPHNFFGKSCQIDYCQDAVNNCTRIFGVCKDVIRSIAWCRRTCGICGDAQILFVDGSNTATKVPVSGGSHTIQPESECKDTINCVEKFGVCRNQTMAETVCRLTCGVCGGVHIGFG